jgi:hypothetical protein
MSAGSSTLQRMPQGDSRSRVLIGALLVGLLGPGCKRSQVWLGRGHEPVESAAPSGNAPAVPTQGTERDAGERDLSSSVDAGNPPLVEDLDAAASDLAATSADSSAPEADGGGPAEQHDAGSQPTFLPTPRGACPALVNGTVRLLDTPVRLWIGAEDAKPGSLLIYWYGVGSSTSEASSRLGAVMDKILDQGGIVAALEMSTGRGADTGTGAWHTGDLEVVDELVACAVANGRIDARRIYTGGCSAGGLTAGTMVYMRSGYLAGAQLDSGGTILNEPLQDPGHVPALIAAHGSKSTDVVIVNFAELSVELASRVAGDGGFAVQCDHGGGHCATPMSLREAQWQFLLAHPFGTRRSPYQAGLPKGFPSECQIAQAP